MVGANKRITIEDIDRERVADKLSRVVLNKMATDPLLMPSELLNRERFPKITANAIVTYSYIFSKQMDDLYEKCMLLDEEGLPYVYLPIQELAEVLCVSKSTATKVMRELIELNLIRKGRSEIGMPDRIYVYKL